MAGEQDDPSDRRRAARIPINAEFASMPSATYISDLSEYGVFLHTPNPSPRGTKLKLRFSVLLDDPVIVEAEGRVVRQQHEPTPGMGIEFTELGPDMILRINDVLSRQRPRDSGPPLSQPTSDPEIDTLEAAFGTPRATEDPLDTATTLRRDPSSKGPASKPWVTPAIPGASKGSASQSGSFRPPPMPGATADENAKTGLFQPVEATPDDDLDDWESE